MLNAIAPPATPPARWRLVGALAMALTLIWAWLSTRAYVGIMHDTPYYALLALARLAPDSLGTDVFLAHGSQDQFSLFSPLLAAVIGRFGLEPALLSLTLAFNLAALLAASALAAALLPSPQRWLAVGLFVAVPSLYGASSVFSYLEPFLTARILAEACVLAGIAAVLRGRRWTAGGMLALGLAAHPIIALPGVLFVALLIAGTATRQAMLFAAGAAGLAAACAVAVVAPIGPLGRLDGDWFDLMHTRSPLLFLSEWGFSDWQRNLVPVCTLGAGLAVLAPDTVVARSARAALALAAGAALVAWVGTALLPITIVVQGQPWRWFWITKAIAVLLLAPVFYRLWTIGGAQRAGAALLLAGWIGHEDALGLPAAMLGLLIVVLAGPARRGGRGLEWAGWALAAGLGALVVQGSYILWFAAVAAAVLAAWWLALAAPWGRAAPLLAAMLALGGVAPAMQAAADRLARRPYVESARQSFAAWRAVIPPSASVLYPNDAPLLWFALGRPSYLSPTQTVSITFSERAALEMRRRATAIDSDYPIATSLTWMATDPGPLDLTPEALARLCAVRGLDFVVGHEPLPMPRRVHPRLLPEPNLYLYDCRDVGTGGVAN
jgi:hypothetical protein